MGAIGMSGTVPLEYPRIEITIVVRKGSYAWLLQIYDTVCHIPVAIVIYFLIILA